MNRTQAPQIKTADTINLLPVQQIKLDNGIPVYIINAGGQDVVKIDFVFEAGKWYEPKNLLADFVNRMMREGVNGKSAKEIADIFEFYGCNLESGVSFTNAGFQLYSLNKYLPQVLPLMFEIFTQASFPQNEFETMLNNRKQKHTERLAKNDYVANRNFLNAMWGPEHPYGRLTQYEDFENVSTEQLKYFYSRYYNAANCFIIIAGRPDDMLIKEVNKVFGTASWLGQHAPQNVMFTPRPHTNLRQHTEKQGSVQSSVMAGNATINKYHADFDVLAIANTILGGYFGSRLMANIREDKGYTYGIYSSLSSYQHGGIFEISAEVGKQVCEATLTEIQNEINTMRSEPVSTEELDTVKNYLTGRLMRSVDGPMKYADVYKGLILYGRDSTYINSYLQTLQTVTAEQIMEMCVKYFDFEKMYKVTVG